MKRETIRLAFFGPMPWDDIFHYGYRKTSGAMLRSLWERPDVERIWYVQHDHRWGMGIKIKNIDTKLTVVGLPIGLPYERFLLIRWINRHLQAFLLKQSILQKSKSDKLIYWFYDWWNIELISLLPRACTVMEVTDRANHFISQRTSQEKRLLQIQKLARELVDFFFPVSAPVAAECFGGRGKVTVLSNGISRDFLAQSRTRQPEPSELQGISHPRLCVVSTGWPLNYRLDHALLLQALEKMPDWRLVLIGCEKIESPALKELVQHPRVTVIGLVPIQNLAAYIQHGDICSVPYKRESENSGDRLKIYEYLACSKPVILTVDEGQNVLRPYLRFAFTVDGFVKVCNELLREPLFEIAKLNSLLDEMTWDKRAEKCINAIQC